MKEVTMFMTPSCPHCQNALKMMEELCCEHPQYKDVCVKQVDERKEAELADRYDYYYIPTFYVGDEKMHEGVPTKEAVQEVYEKACH